MNIGHPNKNLNKLAIQMLVNHLNISISKKNLNEGSVNKILNDNLIISRFDERIVIAIVGAGASTSAGIPASREAVSELRDSLKIPDSIINYELERLESVYRLNRDAFETNLLAFSLHSAGNLREKINEMYLRRHPPILSYEILSHLFKHRFIDIIINFNFDEFLDQSIEDELGEGEYYKIISDGDCPEFLLNDSAYSKDTLKLSLPIYIKPHGTASHKSTLRFTRDDYFGLPTDIRHLIRNIFVYSKLPITVMSIGFSMQSFEINHIIRENQINSNIFYINKSEPKPEPELKHYMSALIKISDNFTLNECLTELWSIIYNYFRVDFAPRGIDRHILLCKIFKDYNISKNTNLNARVKYFENRTKIELLLSIAKSKGLINMSELSLDRCGKYFDFYREAAAMTPSGAKTLSEICLEYGFIETEYGNELLRWNKQEKEYYFDPDKLILQFSEFIAWIKSIYKDIEEIFGNLYADESNNRKFKKQFFELIKKIYEPEETEIKLKHSSNYSKIFKKPEMLKTKTSLKVNTYGLLEEEWKTLLLVAETGAWLLKYNIVKIIKGKINKINKKINMRIIVADMSFESRLKKCYNFCDIEVRKLNWWEHNRHMTILLNSDGFPITSIYFVRRMRSSHVSPIRLNRYDSEIIIKMFCAYWEKTNNNKSRIVDYKRVKNTRKYINEILGI